MDYADAHQQALPQKWNLVYAGAQRSNGCKEHTWLPAKDIPAAKVADSGPSRFLRAFYHFELKRSSTKIIYEMVNPTNTNVTNTTDV